MKNPGWAMLIAFALAVPAAGCLELPNDELAAATADPETLDPSAGAAQFEITLPEGATSAAILVNVTKDDWYDHWRDGYKVTYVTIEVDGVPEDKMTLLQAYRLDGPKAELNGLSFVSGEYRGGIGYGFVKKGAAEDMTFLVVAGTDAENATPTIRGAVLENYAFDLPSGLPPAEPDGVGGASHVGYFIEWGFFGGFFDPLRVNYGVNVEDGRTSNAGITSGLLTLGVDHHVADGGLHYGVGVVLPGQESTGTATYVEAIDDKEREASGRYAAMGGTQVMFMNVAFVNSPFYAFSRAAPEEVASPRLMIDADVNSGDAIIFIAATNPVDLEALGIDVETDFDGGTWFPFQVWTPDGWVQSTPEGVNLSDTALLYVPLD